MKLADLPTPALLIDAGALDRNLSEMAAALPGRRLRPHVKAHKCTELARRQAAAGHPGFTCATIRECEGMAAAGLGAASTSGPSTSAAGDGVGTAALSCCCCGDSGVGTLLSLAAAGGSNIRYALTGLWAEL